jgi:hypothetical protein
MSGSFDVNLLSQIQPPGQKMSVNKDHVSLRKRDARDGRKREGGTQMPLTAEQVDSRRPREGPWGEDEKALKVDITV